MPKLTSCTPYLEVFDMIASKAFYCEVLGFELISATPQVETKEGRFSHFMRIRRGDLDLLLNTAFDSNARPAARDPARERGHGDMALYIDCDDVEALYAELTGRGLPADPPAATGYGYLGFTVKDPDGYRLTFHWPLPGTPEALARSGPPA